MIFIPRYSKRAIGGTIFMYQVLEDVTIQLSMEMTFGIDL
jgi:hypothetical protein